MPEIAFVGRSNVGKSTLLNSLVGQNKLAKTSSTPGRTQLVNYFDINDAQFRFVDLPGYGFHKAGKKNAEMWSRLIESYLLKSTSLKMVFLLVDIRHEPSLQDKQMYQFLFYHQLPCTVIATKCDKVPKSKISNYITVIANKLCIGLKNIIPYSSETEVGKNIILTSFDNL